MAPKRKADDGAADTKSNKKAIPAGKKGSLQGLKLLFTGTFDTMDRKTCEATAKKYGGTIMSTAKLAEADIVVLGTKAGQKKLDEIEENGIKTCDESEFLEMIQSGEYAKDAEDDGVAEEVADDEDGDEEDEPAPKKAKNAAPKKKAAAKNQKAVPEGKPDALKGLKLLFTGTFEIDRTTCEATVKIHGGELVKKLEDADWIILGTKAGPKKLTEINENGYPTMNEAQFFHLLKTGEEPASD